MVACNEEEVLMENLSIQELESTALSYQELMVPALFEKWADRVLDEAKTGPGDKILDVACGTGVLARVAANRSGRSGFVAGLDMNPGMLSVAGKLAPEIAWREGKAEKLPWENDFFDAVVSQFGLMFFEDRQEALREMLRVLQPGGRLVVAVFDSLDNNPAYKAMTEIFDNIIGKEVGQALRFPFSLGDTAELESLCTESGLATALISTRKGRARFPDVKAMVLADVRGWFPLAGFVLDNNQIEEVVRKAEPALSEFTAADGSVEFPVSAHFITYTKTEY